MRRKPLAPLTPEQQQLAADNERLIYLAIHRYAPDALPARHRRRSPARVNPLWHRRHRPFSRRNPHNIF